jgi:hypothetical protein
MNKYLSNPHTKNGNQLAMNAPNISLKFCDDYGD